MTPLLQKTLGDDLGRLPAVIKQHYQIPVGERRNYLVRGSLSVDYPWFVSPILKVVRLFGGLIDIKEDKMSAEVEKWVNLDLPDSLFWQRQITSRTGKTIVFASRMEYQKANELIEHIGFGFGLHLKVSVENDKLVYQSNGHLWQIGKIRIPIPDVLFLGHATISETAISNNEFELDFEINHPLFGVTYRYGGTFKVK